jgi:hypothetical protein
MMNNAHPSHKPAPAAEQPRKLRMEREIDRLSNLPPEWLQKSPAAYNFYRRMVYQVKYPHSLSRNTAPNKLLTEHANQPELIQRSVATAARNILHVDPNGYHFDGKPDKYDYRLPDGCKSRGGKWKIHLNVEPWNFGHVSDYLKKNNYLHKFMSGGDYDSPFTVYFGSWDLTLRESQKISKDLEMYLRKPTYDSFEITRNIGGRFEYTPDDSREKIIGIKLTINGSAGLPRRQENAPYWFKLAEARESKDEEKKDQALIEDLKNLQESFLAMTKLFGSYFHGT